MLEIPESHSMSRQITETLGGKKIEKVVANASPHGFAFYFGDPLAYPPLLTRRVIGEAKPVGGQIEVSASGATLLFGDGANLRYYPAGAKMPAKHQLFLQFTDGSALIGTIQMYGSLSAYPEGANQNPYYLVAVEKPSPLLPDFDEVYFEKMFSDAKPKLSAKAFLATEQRVPGLGNGVLQDILFIAGVHPARAIGTLSDAAREKLFESVKKTLRAMTDLGGRDTEKNLFGEAGGYKTLLSRKTLEFPCPQCGGSVTRKAYLGGNVYFCNTCQPLAG